ncbi:indolepyruvate ferredoxin oxidoreductase family protein [Zavarzinia compransoris]|uniref:Indolepyruvate ferredoxin oxidoreductase family protein n=1 Tax=Zavarzinia compransoris TaxID=1264899 RepID=A0A317DWJ1_9PROT|nr:indolepyruvate ferredoxin oxidoreductase family protein [Zavarzinia compransoris]PWR18901.1 indolepyruvate ferredoxin oxidoreductase family protein [Zavarzinia compransoris]TDP48897.1 indolepyruvate ferredoxin oxidoreductase [Zavarzinia compransoris]
MPDGAQGPLPVTLDDKYLSHDGHILLNGMQALVRLAFEQQRRDREAGLKTGGFISGYRGSPLGGFDLELNRVKPLLEAVNIRFQPGVNEDLAATALWGTQQIALGRKEATVDGVFGFWYGKGPGVDRTGDVFKHANLAGTHPRGGVLAIAGDDHTCKSSTTAHQTEYAFVDAMIPVLAPASLAEIIDYGLAGIALSRHAGVWVALKLVAEIADTTGTIPAKSGFPGPVSPVPAADVHIRWPDTAQAQEARLHLHKLPAVAAFARANGLDRVVERPAGARLGIVTAGKAYGDLLEAFALLGLDPARRAALGIAVYKVALVWPLEPEGIAGFAEGLEELLVVEEKRPLIEDQIKAILYPRAGARPAVAGKRDTDGTPLLKTHDELSPVEVAAALARRLNLAAPSPPAPAPAPAKRTPYFCSGCPHNTSTVVPEGSIAHAGIGCHYMATWMDRATETFTHMGGEGANWIGQAPFVTTRHIFQNLGDGTYFHSGLLAIRAAVAARVPVTYKILYNDAVAMTGGQHHDGPLTPAMIAAQIRAEGVERIALVSDDIKRHDPPAYPPRVSLHDRADLDAVQRELRDIPGVSAIIYDQTCAAEKRRRRKRNLMADPPRRVVINEAVCEGCGDCGSQSNCLSIVPVETEFGRKRQIDQSSCNKDFSCLKGFCPSMVTVEGGRLRMPHPRGGDAPAAEVLPEPALAALPWSGLALGVGGTGIVTLGALLAMAAHVEGLDATVLDQTGLAQKGGAVTSHIRIRAQADGSAVRVPAGGADLILGCDAVVAAGAEARARMAPGRTSAVVNSHAGSIAEFTHDADARLPVADLLRLIGKACGPERVTALEATRLATELVGDAMAANLFLLGIASQQGLLPVAPAAIETAIALNETAAAANRGAFRWGRMQAHDPARVAAAAQSAEAGAEPAHHRLSASLDDHIARRTRALGDYQNRAYGARFARAVEAVRAAEARVRPGEDSLARATAEALYRVMAIKDEYEVARLYTDGDFARMVAARFEGGYRLNVHLSPPLLAGADPATGRPAKRAFGPPVFALFRLLKRLKFLRGTAFDPFGWTAERRAERALRETYLALAEEIARDLTPARHDIAVALMAQTARVRGFGPVKAAAMAAVARDRAPLLAAFRQDDPPRHLARAAE